MLQYNIYFISQIDLLQGMRDDNGCLARHHGKVSYMKHFTWCDEAITTFTIKKQFIVSEMEKTILMEIYY